MVAYLGTTKGKRDGMRLASLCFLQNPGSSRQLCALILIA